MSLYVSQSVTHKAVREKHTGWPEKTDQNHKTFVKGHFSTLHSIHKISVYVDVVSDYFYHLLF